MSIRTLAGGAVAFAAVVWLSFEHVRLVRALERVERRSVTVERAVERLERAECDIAADIARGEAAAGVQRGQGNAEEAPSESVVARAIKRGRAVIETALGVGRWTNADRDKLREQLVLLPEEQADDLMNKVVAGLNSGKLANDYRGSPF